MPKVEKGRLSGLWGMHSYTSKELDDWADEIEAQVTDPTNQDDPKWLRRWAGRIRRLAQRKEKAREHKTRQ